MLNLNKLFKMVANSQTYLYNTHDTDIRNEIK
ncbi:hypothetical protein V12B01_24609 [Vibrio splendidus 12B01]|nr:hypothetical protein V12B01_24609 [Vibrio splendidus 12B01]